MGNESGSLEYTPAWIFAGVCFITVFLSLCAERGLHPLGKFLMRKKQGALFVALQKFKEDLMLLGFISFLLIVFQSILGRICISTHLASHMHPCKKQSSHIATHGELLLTRNYKRGLLSPDESVDICARKGQVPLLSIEASHQLQKFIFVLAVVHVIFCATAMVLGEARVRRWKRWEDSIRRGHAAAGDAHRRHHEIFRLRASGYWRKVAIVSWMISFMKQFYGSVTKSDYIALRHGFKMAHLPLVPESTFDFHDHMMRILEGDFIKIVSISWFFWLFIVVFLLLYVQGWNTYFWLSFLPLILLLLVGAKLEHIIMRFAQEVDSTDHDHEAARVKPSDDHFWFRRPGIILRLIQFILFQNSFEIAFFFWIWSTYGLHSCIMEKPGFIITRLIIGVIVQVLCSYSTLPLYALVSKMGTSFEFGHRLQPNLGQRLVHGKGDHPSGVATASHSHGMGTQSLETFHVAEQAQDIEVENGL
ncbi:hypothetical protein EUGRSUZ_I02799 [Eucalyptus grandis]|uniref:MLO-like protein n=2 Tax=Eucalyptus grandis TaxID=71139 RepID=A0A059AT82_EUCGR|nr:hypothetical protein EUGRSUZ_I02799 [Eucalyptus grandis]